MGYYNSAPIGRPLMGSSSAGGSPNEPENMGPLIVLLILGGTIALFGVALFIKECILHIK